MRIVEKVVCDINRTDLIINVGGSYDLDDNPENIFYSSFKSLAKQFEEKYSVRFYAEPGRAIVLSAGDIVTRVDLIRKRKGDVEIYIDAGQQTKITWTPSTIQILNREPQNLESETRYHFYGSLSSHVELFSFCTSIEFAEGDMLKLNPMGAYTNCFASHWHGLPFAELTMID